MTLSFVLFALLLQGLQPGTGIVTGTIQVTGGGSAAGIRVGAIAIDDPTGAGLLSVAETDSSGRFRLTNVPQGRYYIVAGKLSSPTYYPGGTDRERAKEVVVEPARTASSVNFAVPADSKRPVSPVYSAGATFSATEYIAYSQIMSARDAAAKEKLLQDFEKNYPKSALLPDIYVTLIDFYASNNNLDKAVAYAERLLKRDANNVTALVRLSRAYALMRNDLGLAIQYADRAVAAVSRLRSQAPRSDPQAWQSWVAAMDTSATSNRVWLKQMAEWQQKALFNAMIRKR
jgi:hypothetical protein